MPRGNNSGENSVKTYLMAGGGHGGGMSRICYASFSYISVSNLLMVASADRPPSAYLSGFC